MLDDYRHFLKLKTYKMTKELIIEAFKSFSSGRSVDQDEIDFLIKKECECDQCGENILGMYDFPRIDIESDELLCEDCEKEIKYQTCAICEESFDKPETPAEHRFFISKAGEKQIGIKSGIYQVKKFPFYYGCLIGGFESFFDDAIEFISTTDVEAINKLKYGKNGNPIAVDEICPECFGKYTGQKRIKHNYTNRKYSLNLDITIRGMIHKNLQNGHTK